MPHIELRAVPPFLLPDGPAAAWREAGDLLDGGELLRARAMEPAAAARFVAGRLAQRKFAAELLSLPAEELAAAYSCRRCGTGAGIGHGRPGYLFAGDQVPLALSLSRAAGWTLLAAVIDPPPGLRLGVDAEDPARMDFEGFDEVALTPAERSSLAPLEGALLQVARAQLWTRKEAWLKMTGDGLNIPPASLDVRDLAGLRTLEPVESGLPAHLAAAVALSTS